MKKILTLICLILSINSFSQKVVYDSLNNQKTTISPMIIEDDLVQTVYVERDGKFAFSLIDKITDCQEYRQFKKDFPEFMVPKRISDKYIKCRSPQNR